MLACFITWFPPPIPLYWNADLLWCTFPWLGTWSSSGKTQNSFKRRKDGEACRKSWISIHWIALQPLLLEGRHDLILMRRRKWFAGKPLDVCGQFCAIQSFLGWILKRFVRGIAPWRCWDDSDIADRKQNAKGWLQVATTSFAISRCAEIYWMNLEYLRKFGSTHQIEVQQNTDRVKSYCRIDAVQWCSMWRLATSLSTLGWQAVTWFRRRFMFSSYSCSRIFVCI